MISATNDLLGKLLQENEGYSHKGIHSRNESEDFFFQSKIDPYEDYDGKEMCDHGITFREDLDNMFEPSKEDNNIISFTSKKKSMVELSRFPLHDDCESFKDESFHSEMLVNLQSGVDESVKILTTIWKEPGNDEVSETGKKDIDQISQSGFGQTPSTRSQYDNQVFSICWEKHKRSIQLGEKIVHLDESSEWSISSPSSRARSNKEESRSTRSIRQRGRPAKTVKTSISALWKILEPHFQKMLETAGGNNRRQDSKNVSIMRALKEIPTLLLKYMFTKTFYGNKCMEVLTDVYMYTFKKGFVKLLEHYEIPFNIQSTFLPFITISFLDSNVKGILKLLFEEGYLNSVDYDTLSSCLDTRKSTSKTEFIKIYHSIKSLELICELVKKMIPSLQVNVKKDNLEHCKSQLLYILTNLTEE